jgi:hypothetical protein
MTLSTPGPTNPAAWYDEDANPVVVHGPYADGQPEAKAAALDAGATSPVCIRWSDKARVEAYLASL